jgi:hypothetical protein
MQNDARGNSKVERQFVHSATFLPLKSWLYMIQFQIMTARVIKQAKKSEGMIDYAVRADFSRKHFWTLSVWKDRDLMRRFVLSEPHATAMKKFERWAGEGSAFVEWTSPGRSADWTTAMKQLENPTFYYKKKQ